MTELPITTILLVLIVFLAAFEQTISGFGFSLMVMPVATLLLGLKVAVPLTALAGLTVYTINLIRYHQSINMGEAVPLGFAAAFGVPVGIWGLANLDEHLVKLALGFILIAYAAYSAHALYHISPSTVRGALSQQWGYVAGFLTGCLGSAYNTPGPPLVVYGSLRCWPRNEFRAVLQALFFFTGCLAVLAHYVTQNLTTNVVTLYAYALPALVFGNIAGSLSDRYVDHQAFRVIVIAMVFVLGLSLVLGGR